jgi:hypothetical protein
MVLGTNHLLKQKRSPAIGDLFKNKNGLKKIIAHINPCYTKAIGDRDTFFIYQPSLSRNRFKNKRSNTKNHFVQQHSSYFRAIVAHFVVLFDHWYWKF